MKIRLPITLLSFAGMLTVSAAGHADAPAMNACIKAFTETRLTEHKVVAVHKETEASSSLVTHPKTVTIELTARSTAAGHNTVAKAVCVATPSGEILSMSGEPAVDAKLAAR